jgi:hypothetical protein
MVQHKVPVPSIVAVVFLLAAGCSAADKDARQADTKTPDSTAAPPDKLTIYYFHTNYRCWTCNQFERLTKEVLNEDYAERLSSGVVDFKAINVEEDNNKHFIQEYRLVTKSLILSLEGQAKELEWKNLDQIWALARDAEKFKSYVRKGINQYLEKIG